MLSVGASSRWVKVSSRHLPFGHPVRTGRGGFSNNLDNNVPERGWRADVAQVVERLTCNQQVVGSTPTIGSMFAEGTRRGEVPERPKGADCKSAGVRLRRFESSPLHCERASRTKNMRRGSSSVGRARAFQARGRGFDSRLPLVAASVGRMIDDGYAHVAQVAEHFLGKEEVTGSNPVMGSGMAASSRERRGPVRFRCAI